MFIIWNKGIQPESCWANHPYNIIADRKELFMNICFYVDVFSIQLESKRELCRSNKLKSFSIRLSQHSTVWRIGRRETISWYDCLAIIEWNTFIFTFCLLGKLIIFLHYGRALAWTLIVATPQPNLLFPWLSLFESLKSLPKWGCLFGWWFSIELTWIIFSKSGDPIKLCPQIFVLCVLRMKKLGHLFLHCPVAKEMWHRIMDLSGESWIAPKGVDELIMTG